MNRRFHKRAISAAAAILTLTSAVTVTSASQRNEITLESSTSSASAGEVFNVDLGLKTDSKGVSGFTIDFCFDPEAVTLDVAQSSEYTPNGGFTIVTNYEYDKGVVRLVGANMNSENVTKDSVLASLVFTVNDDWKGDIDFWTEVDTLVASEGDDFINVDCRSYGPYNPYTVEGPAEEDSSAAETTTTTEAETTTTTVTETSAETSSPTQTLPSEYIPDSSLPDEIIPEKTTTTEAVTEPDDSSADNDNESGALYVHRQGNEDYNNEEPLQYTFSPYDYVENADEPVDISVSVYSDGSAQGGIGMQTADGWKIFSSETGSGEQTWKAENIDLTDVYGDVAVQLYYLKNNSEFKINSISITPANSETPDEPVQTEPVVTTLPSNDLPAESEDTTPTTTVPESIEPIESISDTEATEPEAPADDKIDDIVIDDESSADDKNASDESKADEDASEPADSSSEVNADTNSTNGSASDSQTSSDTQTTTTAASNVESAVNNASAKADVNPDTGNGIGLYVCGAVGVLCVAQIGYSIYALTRKKEEE